MKEIREGLLELLGDKLKRFEIKESEIQGKFDLVNSGFVNSMEFVDLVATLEKRFRVEIDYEKALEMGDFTTVDGLLKAFESAKHE